MASSSFNPSATQGPYVLGLIPAIAQQQQSRGVDPAGTGQYSGPRSRFMSQPALTDRGGFQIGVVPGSGNPGTVYAVSQFSLKLLENLSRELGVTFPKDSMEANLRDCSAHEIRRNQRDWEPMITAFERQHHVELPKLFEDGLNPATAEGHFVDSVYVRRGAFLEAIQRVSLSQPQHPPSQAAGTSHLNPANFGNLA